MAHMVENSGAAVVRLTPAELGELDSAVRAIEIRGQRLPDQVLVFSPWRGKFSRRNREPAMWQDGVVNLFP